MGVWAAVDIDNGGVFLGRVEADGYHHAIIQVGCAVGRFDSAASVVGYVIALPWIFGCEITFCFLALNIHNGDVAGLGGGGVAVEEVGARSAEAATMVSFAVLVE